MAELVEAAEAVEDVVEEIVDAARVVSLRAATVALMLTGGVSAAAGYFIAERKLRLKYEKLAEEEIDGMREHFRQRLVARETPKPSVEELGRVTAELGYDSPAQPWPKSDPPIPEIDDDVEEPEQHNVFEDQFIWDQEAENAKRNEDDPYVIHTDERNEDEYTQTTMTYYEGDDTLCDSSDRIVSEVDAVVGIENLDRFGHGSNDPNIVYVRNAALTVEIEVVKSEGTYAEEVQGLTHSDEPHERPTAWDG